MASPAYKSMTIRNWNTTTKLLELLEAQPKENDCRSTQTHAC